MNLIPTNVAIRVTEDTLVTTLRELQTIFPKLRWRSGHKPVEWRPYVPSYLCIDSNSNLCSGKYSPLGYRLRNLRQLKNTQIIRKELTSA